MEEKKEVKRAERLAQIHVYIKQKMHSELFELMKVSGKKSMSEVIRGILEETPIRRKRYDASLDHIMPELSDIRRQLKAIAENVDQTAGIFQAVQWPDDLLDEANEVAQLYLDANVSIKSYVDRITKIILKWLSD